MTSCFFFLFELLLLIVSLYFNYFSDTKCLSKVTGKGFNFNTQLLSYFHTIHRFQHNCLISTQLSDFHTIVRFPHNCPTSTSLAPPCLGQTDQLKLGVSRKRLSDITVTVDLHSECLQTPQLLSNKSYILQNST